MHSASSLLFGEDRFIVIFVEWNLATKYFSEFIRDYIFHFEVG